LLNPIIVQVNRCLLIRYGWATFCVLLLLLASLLSSHEPKMELAEALTAKQRPELPLGYWDISRNQADILTFTSSVPMADGGIATSEWWNAENARSGRTAFMLVENIDKLSKLMTHTNSNNTIIQSSSYQIALNNNNTGDVARIESQVQNESRFC
jgi:hypothetical protein